MPKVSSLWLIIGVFVDGWAHMNLAQLETFFTPWHALFYSGFARARPTGWPALIVTSPLRAAWAAADDHDADRLRSFLPVVLSLALLTAVISFFLMWISAFFDTSPGMSAAGWRPEWGPYPGDGRLIEQGLTSAFITNLVFDRARALPDPPVAPAVRRGHRAVLLRRGLHELTGGVPGGMVDRARRGRRARRRPDRPPSRADDAARPPAQPDVGSFGKRSVPYILTVHIMSLSA